MGDWLWDYNRYRPHGSLGLAPPGLVVADRLDLGLLRVPFLAHVCRVYGGGLVVGQPPDKYFNWPHLV